MRTTLDIEDDVLQAAKELAAHDGITTGRMLSQLARKGLYPPETRTKGRVRNGVPIFPKLDEVITFEHVQKLMEQEGV